MALSIVSLYLLDKFLEDRTLTLLENRAFLSVSILG